jgi:hypothetical protein
MPHPSPEGDAPAGLAGGGEQAGPAHDVGPLPLPPKQEDGESKKGTGVVRVFALASHGRSPGVTARHLTMAARDGEAAGQGQQHISLLRFKKKKMRLTPSPLNHPPTAALDPLSLAAAAASRARRKARAAARLAPRVGAAGLGVKAFVCGVRWGVRLAPAALASPASLAAALDAALADDAVACGTGQLLGVLMLGRDGRTHAFGSAAGKAGAAGRSGVDAEAASLVAAAESWDGWGAAAATAARLYVSDAMVVSGYGAA